ncbi:unnamed protein product, partial [marine sediment metagenome]
LDDSPNDHYVYVDGVLRHTTTRSWAVTKCNADWDWIESNNYDCYGDIANATAMKNYLNALPAGTNVIINTYDEPKTNVYDNDDLITALESVGATGSEIKAIELNGSYLLIGQKGVGAGKGIFEKRGPASGVSIYFDIEPSNLLDGVAATQWASGAIQAIGHYIQVDLGEVISYLGSVRVNSSETLDPRNCFADRFKILISSTGDFDGEEIEVFSATEDFAISDPLITFIPTSGRYIRVELTQAKAVFHWQVGELEVKEWQVAD